jgi:hypothetical protein
MTLGTSNPVSYTTADGTCLGSTCLKWAADGELSELDVQLVLERLRRADAELCQRRDPAAEQQESLVSPSRCRSQDD